MGGLLFVLPSAGAVNLVWVIGLPTIILGIWLISLAFRLRGLLRKVTLRVRGPQPEIEAAMQTYRHILEEKHRLKSNFRKELFRERNSGSEN